MLFFLRCRIRKVSVRVLVAVIKFRCDLKQFSTLKVKVHNCNRSFNQGGYTFRMSNGVFNEGDTFDVDQLAEELRLSIRITLCPHKKIHHTRVDRSSKQSFWMTGIVASDEITLSPKKKVQTPPFVLIKQNQFGGGI